MPLEFNPAHVRIGIIGLGYVSLPLAVEFARKYAVVGFDVKQSRIEELRRGEDSTREVDPADLRAAGNWGCRFPRFPETRVSSVCSIFLDETAQAWRLRGWPWSSLSGYHKHESA